MTIEQYRNLQKLPSIEKCEMVKKEQDSIEEYIKDIEFAMKSKKPKH